MKANELKIGDYVSYKGKPAKIHALDSPCIYVDADGEIWGTLEDDGDISPMPLTEEILEKNGWEKGDVQWILFNLVIQYNKVDDNFTIYVYQNEEYNYLTEIEYIHELQHILWALGMDDDLKI